jgi:hypothetical protein
MRLLVGLALLSVLPSIGPIGSLIPLYSFPPP